MWVPVKTSHKAIAMDIKMVARLNNSMIGMEYQYEWVGVVWRDVTAFERVIGSRVLSRIFFLLKPRQACKYIRFSSSRQALALLRLGSSGENVTGFAITLPGHSIKRS